MINIRIVALLILCIGNLVLSVGTGYAGESKAKKYYKEGIEYFKKGDYENHVASCKKAIEADPKYLDAYFGLGRGYILLHKPKEAVAVYEKMLSIDHNSGDAYLGLGEIYWKEEENYQKAINAFKKALEVEPNNANNKTIYVALAGVYKESKLYNECLSALEKAKNLDPEYGDVYAGFGDYYARLKQTEKARENYIKSISLYRSKGFEDLAVKYEKILNKIGKPIVHIYLKSRCVATGRIIEETDEYVKVEGDIFCPGPGDGFMIGEGGESTYNKREIERVEVLGE